MLWGHLYLTSTRDSPQEVIANPRQHQQVSLCQQIPMFSTEKKMVETWLFITFAIASSLRWAWSSSESTSLSYQATSLIVNNATRLDLLELPNTHIPSDTEVGGFWLYVSGGLLLSSCESKLVNFPGSANINFLVALDLSIGNIWNCRSIVVDIPFTIWLLWCVRERAWWIVPLGTYLKECAQPWLHKERAPQTHNQTPP